jgi:hypothetical protein
MCKQQATLRWGYAGVLLVMIAAVLLAVPPVRGADEAASAVDAQTAALFETTYGQRLKTTLAERDDNAIINLADELLGDLPRYESQRAMQLMICEKAYELTARRSGGVAVAERAMLELRRIDPQRSAEAGNRVLQAYESAYRSAAVNEQRHAAMQYLDRLFAAGDEKLDARAWSDAEVFYRKALSVGGAIAANFRTAANYGLSEVRRGAIPLRRMEVLSKRLAAKADDLDAARQLAQTYLVHLDDAAAALPHAVTAGDAELQTVARTLQDSVQGAGGDAKVLMQVAAWCVQQSQADDVNDAVKLGLSRRAKALYGQASALRGHLSESELRTVTSELSRLGDLEASLLQRRAEGREMPSIHGTLTVFANMSAVVYHNDKMLMHNNWEISSASVDLRPGDIIKAKLNNANASKGFWLRFRSDDGRMIFYSTPAAFRCYTPRDMSRWWQVSPSAADLPCRKEVYIDGEMLKRISQFDPQYSRDQIIWGSDRVQWAYVYMVVR